MNIMRVTPGKAMHKFFRDDKAVSFAMSRDFMGKVMYLVHLNNGTSVTLTAAHFSAIYDVIS